MNQQNAEYLKNNIKYLGFSDSIFPELMRNMENGQPEFVLRHEREYGPEKLETQLNFRKSQTTDMYFLNLYSASLIKPNQERISQMIYLDKGNGLTQKETYNLLHGRSVNQDLTNKQGEKYNAWVQLDFSEKDPNGNYKVKQYHEAYKYDLAATLHKYGIKELGNDQLKERLIQSLQRGNLQQVTFEKNGASEKLWIEANPQFKSLNVYDEHNQKIYMNKIAEKYGHAQVQSPAQKQSATVENNEVQKESHKPLKEKMKADDQDAPKEKQEKRIKQSHKS